MQTEGDGGWSWTHGPTYFCCCFSRRYSSSMARRDDAPAVVEADGPADAEGPGAAAEWSCVLGRKDAARPSGQCRSIDRSID